jgi:hypothetical protein
LRIALLATVIVCLAVILGVLIASASEDVRSSAYYLSAYELLAGLWLAGALRLFPFLGVSPRDDIVERKNRAALSTVVGALAGVTACFAGSNVGNGPGPECVIFCAVLTSGVFFLLWLLSDFAGSNWADAVTIDRDRGAGLRLGSLLLSIGLAIGSAATGDWVSAGDTVKDLALRGWPVIPVLSLALLSERPLRRVSKAYLSWAAAAAYVCLAVFCIAIERGSR